MQILMIHKDIQIFGMVQGVGFRYSARHAARNYGIKGYVRNMPDGSVYIEAEGKEQNMSEFIKWCMEGPGPAYIENIKVEDGTMKNFEFFDIRF
jgi:acylphosphatase